VHCVNNDGRPHFATAETNEERCRQLMVENNLSLCLVFPHLLTDLVTKVAAN
jgi:hypothetical protein